MKELLKDAAKALYRFLTHRILWLFLVLVVLFYILLARLFELQIILAETFRAAPPRTTTAALPLQAPRGSIYDSQGRPLAVNRMAYVVKMDTSLVNTHTISNEALYALVKIFERNGEAYVDEFPITVEEPYAFTYPDNNWRLWYEHRWKDDMAIPSPHTATAQESFEYLREYFKIDPELPNGEARKILNLRCMIFMERMLDINNYNPRHITLAHGISHETLAAIEEWNALFTGVYIDIQTLREYPQGIYFSHMLGYIREISDEELKNNMDKGYTQNDLIGKAGLERSMESYLRGKDGSQTIEADAAGRRIGLPLEVIEPEPGNVIFLTIDAELQKKAYHALENALAQALAGRITLRNNNRETALTLKEIFISMIKSNNLPFNLVLEAEKDTDSYVLRKYILDRFPAANATQRESIEKIKTILCDGIEAGRVTPAMLLLAMIDLGILSDPGGLATRLKSAPNTARDVVIDKILSKELSPRMLNLDPCTGSAVIIDVRDGSVLAAIGYPSYDNNRLVNVFDNAYYNQINNNDPTHPMINRPFMEPRAPGSTFKMITAAAALESGVLTPATRIMDGTHFTKAGKPYTNCWSLSWSHGSINVKTALQVSCNYFFCEAAWRLGNVSNGKTAAGIQTLNNYMEYFGLNDKTGVEIGELYNQYDTVPELHYKISSPEFQKYLVQSRDIFADRSQWAWSDGDTVRTSIGQSINNYTPAMMARYISVIANRGLRYPLHLVQTITDFRGNTVKEYEAVPDVLDMDISDKTWDAIIEGMRLVTERGGYHTGTGVNVFDGFPIRVAGKTGTAQQIMKNRFEHSSFAAFAPLENPQIAVYVSVPFGVTQAYSQITAHICKELIGEALGLNHRPEPPEPVNVISR